MNIKIKNKILFLIYISLFTTTICEVKLNPYYYFSDSRVKSKDFIVNQRKDLSFHKPYFSKEFQNKPCNTNLPIQLSLVLSDRLKLDNNIYLSPMYLIECLNPIETPYSCNINYNDSESLMTDINKMLDILKEKGAVLTNSRPYDINKETGIFNTCANFQNEIPSLETNPFTLITYHEEKDIETEAVKEVLYNKGSMLAVINAPASFLFDYRNVGKPYIMDDSPKKGFFILRVIGWRTIDNIEYWVFSFTFDKDFGIFNYGMIEFKKANLTFMDITTKEIA